MAIERTIFGACGVDGCLDCEPLFIRKYNSDIGETKEYQITAISFTHKMEDSNNA